MTLLKEYTRGYKTFYTAGLLGYLLIGIVLIPYFLQGADIDFISYAHIGKKYFMGYTKEAINAYWSPMLAWLMIPSYWLELDPAVYFRWLNLIAGFFSLCVFIKIIEKTTMTVVFRLCCFAVLACLLGYFHLTVNKPDYLVVLPVALYLYLLGDFERFFSDRKNYLKIALLGLVCYFTKSFFLFYIATHLTGYCVYHLWQRQDKKQVVFFYAKTMLLFVLGAGVWIGTLCWKYQKFVVSSSGSYNHAIMTPEGVQHFYFTMGLAAPPEPRSIYVFEDPTYFNAHRPGMFSSKEAFINQLKIYRYNYTNAYYLFRYFSYLGTVLVLLLFLVPFLKKDSDREKMSFYSASVLLYIFGYTLVLIDDQRYILCVLLFAVLIAFSVIGEWVQRRSRVLWIQVAIGLVLWMSFVKNVYYDFAYWNKTREYFRYATQLAARMPTEIPALHNANIATNAGKFGPNITTLAAFYAGGKSFSEFAPQHSEAHNQASAEKYNIDYLFFYTNPEPVLCEGGCATVELPDWLKEKKIIYQDSTINLYVLEL
jgi:hypothetical protein